jgi:CO/xanthine dehydrogenase FAD-binding subunit
MNTFDYHTPETLEQAWTLFQANPGAVFLAGGTDYLPLLKSGLKTAKQLIGLRRIPYLRKVELRSGALFVGAAMTLTELGQEPQIREHFPALGRATAFVASPQIRNQGTIGGNLLQDRRCMYFNQSAH